MTHKQFRKGFWHAIW